MRPPRDNRAVTTVEFSVVLTFVLMLVFTVLGLGMLYLGQQAMNYGVERAARYAVVKSATATASTVASAFRAAVAPALGSARAAACQVTDTFSPSNAPGGVVTVSATLAWTSPLRLTLLPAVTLSSSHTLTIQH